MQYAIDNFDRLNKAYGTAKTSLDNQWFYEQAEGVETQHRAGYWPWQWEMKEEYPTVLPPKGFGENRSFLKERNIESFADALVGGYKPTDSQMNIFEARFRSGMKVIGMKQFWNAGKSVIDPLTNQPVVRNIEGDGKGGLVKHPGYDMTSNGEQPIEVLREYAGLYSALLGHSVLQESRVGRATMKGISWFKEGKTLFDTFHMGVVSMRGFFLNPYATMTGKAKPHEGMVLMDNTPNEIRLMANRGEIPKEYLEHYLEQRDWQERGIRNGFNIGRVADNFSGDVIKDIPIVGDYNRFLFGEWQRGTMAQAFHLECERTARMLPELSKDKVASRVAGDLNRRFGQMGRQGWFKNPTWQDISRINAFAPSWLEGEIRSDYGAVYGLKETARYAMQGRLVYNSLVKQAAVGMVSSLAAMQVLNMVTRGHPTWENPEEGFSNKLCAWIPSLDGKGPGIMLNPLGTVFPFFDRIIHYMEKTGSLAKTAEEIAKSKGGVLPQAIFAAFESTRKDPSTWKAIKSVGEAILPMPISAGAVGSALRSTEHGQLQEKSPGQVETQMARSLGIHASPSPGPETRIYGLADDFKAKYRSPTGVKQKPEKQFDESDYRELIQGLKQDDPDRQEEAMEELTKHKEVGAIAQFFRNYPTHPFTGNRKMEVPFLNSLNPEQKEQYKKAREQRMEVNKRFFSRFGKRLNSYRQGPYE